MKARRTPGFPWYNTFTTRFGSKHQFAARIQGYCKERAGYDDVQALCAAIKMPDPLPPDEDVEPEEKWCFVYLMKRRPPRCTTPVGQLDQL